MNHFFQGRQKQRQKQRGRSGQIAVFVVLIFQVLFVFFAFALNVALVVHDKINLQNSIDLAALYGAQKQAEVLNVLAHINFQMRQNFKLLTFRYRVVGSVTFNKGPSPAGGEFWCPFSINPPGTPNIYKYCHRSSMPFPPGGTSTGFAGVTVTTIGPPPSTIRPCDGSPYGPDYCDANYFVCVSSSIWRGRGPNMDTSTNHCKHLETALQPVVSFPIVPGNPLIGPAIDLLDQNMDLADTLAAKCRYEGIYNWLTTQMFLGHFRLDQKDRKSMIREIYNRTLQIGRDLDGNLIRDGALKTFEKNLTYTNRKNFPKDKHNLLVTFNSPESKTFKDFFKAIEVYPVLEYLDFPTLPDHSIVNSDSGNCGQSKRVTHFNLPKRAPYPPPFTNSYKSFMDAWKWLFALSTRAGTVITPPPPPSDPPLVFVKDVNKGPLVPMALGYERNLPGDGVFYYGLSVTLEYSTAYPLFFPGLAGGGLKLKASAFAKPFGGRMGPNYSQGEEDPLIKPIHIKTGNSNFVPGNPYLLKPNYSRYPGDEWGLIHREVHENYYLKQLDGGYPSSLNPWPFDIIYFSHLYGGDPLAYEGQRAKHRLFLRMMELMAVAPDLYDLTYYSPLNQYMTAYFPRICHLLTGRACPDDRRDISIGNVSYGGATVEVFLRGDFGFPYTKEYARLNKSNFNSFTPLSPFYFNLGKTGFVDTHLGSVGPSKFINPGKAPWLAKDPAHFLTAWAPVTAKARYDKYDFPDQVFGKCQGVAKTEDDHHIPTGCAEGGRSGYSVKLISCETARALEPPPPNFPCS